MNYLNGLTRLFLLVSFMAVAGAMQAGTVTEEFSVDGLKVILQHSPKEVVTAKFFIRGGTSNYTKEQEGIEHFALRLAAEGGTVTIPKDAFHSRLEEIGATVVGSSTYDYGEISLKCIRQFWLPAWELFTRAITEPAFPAQEFSLLKEKLIADAQQAVSDPDMYIRMMAFDHAFEGKAYSKRTAGSEASLQKMTLEQVQAHYRKILTKSQCFLVVVGDISREELTQLVRKAFATLPAGNYQPVKGVPLRVEKSSLYSEQRDIATNYMRGMMSAPAIASPDQIPMQLAMSIFNDRLFVEIRTKRNLSYAPGAYYPELLNAYCFVYASTDDPNQVAQVIIDEITGIKKNGFSEKELKNKKGKFLTYHYLELETTDSQAESLGAAEVQGSWRRTQQFMDEVLATDLARINKMFPSYFKGIKWVYLGDTSLPDQQIFNKNL